MTYTYTIRTDGVMMDIDARDMDEAARIFAARERIAGVTDVDSLRLAIAHIDDGGWVWAQSARGPDGARRSYYPPPAED